MPSTFHQFISDKQALKESYISSSLASSLASIFSELLIGQINIKDATREMDKTFKQNKIDDSMKQAIKQRIKYLSAGMELL